MAKSKQTEAAGIIPGAESEYTVAELAAASHIFGTRPDVVTAALSMAGITKTTQRNAAAIVEAFRKREVK